MKILISGASGLVGKVLVERLKKDGHEVLRLVRQPSQEKDTVSWSPKKGVVDRSNVDGIEAVVHLAGESIANKRWSEDQKQEMQDSRLRGTLNLSQILESFQPRPHTLISASAVGFYGNRGDELLEENSGNGTGFLAGLCKQWEESTLTAEEAGIRVAHLRIGIILSQEGGALKKMLPPFKLGLGGRIGNGRQYMSWIHLDDVVEAILHILHHKEIKGPVNVVGPSPETNRDFTRALGAALGRPSLFPFPAFAAKLVLGELADELLLASTRVQPKVLLDSGFKFRHPTLAGALSDVLR